jgi:iron complex transport system substrate-binding protein
MNIIFRYIIIPIVCHLSIITSVYAIPPNRIISLAPNLTEIIFELGLGDSVVGVTSFCDYPEGARGKPKVGGMSNPSLEAVVSLKPDIVVMTTDGNPKEFEERLHSFKIKTYVFKARRLSELPQGIRDMGLKLGAEKQAEELVKKINDTINKYKLSTALYPFPLKQILFIVWPEPLIVAGPGTAINDAITLLGGENIASFAKVSYPKYSIEAIIHQSPDVIIIGKGHENIKKISSRLLGRLQSLPAVQNNNICYVSDNLYRLGPRIIKGIEELHECLKK